MHATLYKAGLSVGARSSNLAFLCPCLGLASAARCAASRGNQVLTICYGSLCFQVLNTASAVVFKLGEGTPLPNQPTTKFYIGQPCSLPSAQTGACLPVAFVVVLCKGLNGGAEPRKDVSAGN